MKDLRILAGILLLLGLCGLTYRWGLQDGQQRGKLWVIDRWGDLREKARMEAYNAAYDQMYAEMQQAIYPSGPVFFANEGVEIHGGDSALDFSHATFFVRDCQAAVKVAKDVRDVTLSGGHYQMWNDHIPNWTLEQADLLGHLLRVTQQQAAVRME